MQSSSSLDDKSTSSKASHCKNESKSVKIPPDARKTLPKLMSTHSANANRSTVSHTSTNKKRHLVLVFTYLLRVISAWNPNIASRRRHVFHPIRRRQSATIGASHLLPERHPTLKGPWLERRRKSALRSSGMDSVWASSTTEEDGNLTRQETLDATLLTNASSDSFWVTGDSKRMELESVLQGSEDVPLPTENGGFSHTKASRAKISAANKGKTPWNKGVHRSEEVKARIGIGVRAKIRERFLERLNDLGVTEEEFEESKRKERREKDAERRARRTEKGGYRPTEQTKRKISDILKQKHAAGEIKPRTINPDNVRRGFTHSEETRQKISNSLKKRWANDPEYRAKMVEISKTVNTKDSVRQKISDSLREKWRDEGFRETMLSKFATRRFPESNTQRRVQEHRDKISASIKAKWQDEAYRAKTTASMARRKAILAASTSSSVPVPPPRVKSKPSDTMARSKVSSNNANTNSLGLGAVIPKPQVLGTSRQQQQKPLLPALVDLARAVQPRTAPHAKGAKTGRKPAPKKSKPMNQNDMHSEVQHHTSLASSDADVAGMKQRIDANHLLGNMEHGMDEEFLYNGNEDAADGSKSKAGSSPAKGLKKQQPACNGNVDLLKEERRDLYDLLYSDDDDDSHASSDESPIPRLKPNGSNTLSSVFSLGDENLDTFDPYGLDDF